MNILRDKVYKLREEKFAAKILRNVLTFVRIDDSIEKHL